MSAASSDMTTATPTVMLRDYQTEALSAIAESASRGVNRQLLVLPTGTGKTVVFAELIRRRGDRALILVHRDELIRQAVEKLGVVVPGADIGVVKAERDEHRAPIVVASVQTLARASRLERLAGDFRTVVVDEAHHLAADTYQRVLMWLHVGEPEGPLAVGVTATPERADGTTLAGWTVVYRRELLEMIQRGYLADLRAIRLRLAADFSTLHVRAGDVIDSEAEALLLAADAPEHVARGYLEHAPGRRAIVFTPTVKVAHAMAKAFETNGVRAEALDGGTPLEIRREILQRFHCGDTSIVTNCAVLTEGFDEPRVGCIIVARPTRSRLLYLQMIGRGTRPFPGKRDCLLLDVVGATTRHDLLTAATVLQVTRTRTLAERGVIEALEEERKEQRRRESAGRLIAETVELFRRRPLHWIAAGPQRFTLTLGRGMLVLQQRGDRWDVVVREHDESRVLARDLPLEYAQGVAEDHARKVGAGALIDPNAAWRTAPATERQLAALRRWRIRPREGLTKGEASDLLSAKVAGVAR